MPTPKQILLLCFFCSGFFHARSQNCSCKELTTELIQKIESDYAGYIHQVKQKDSMPYVRLKRKLLIQSAKTNYLDCYVVLNQLVGYFKDEHLFIAEFPRYTAAQSDSFLRQIPKYQLPAVSKPATTANADPIEGSWRDADQELEIVKVGPGKFYGVIKESTVARWQPGFVKLELQRTSSGAYNIKYYKNNFSWIRFTGVQIYKRVLLAFGIYKLAKINPEDPESQYINPTDPALPFFSRLTEHSLLLTIPSALIERRIMDSIFRVHQQEISKAQNLILDLRSNRGGNNIWGSLYRIANTKLYGSPKTPGKEDFLMLASEDNAGYFDQFQNYFPNDSIGKAYYTNLCKRIRDNTGKFIGFSFYDPNPDTAKREVLEYPLHIAVIAGKGVGSAAEAVILSLKENSTKVKVYGENTAGIIDYVNVHNLKLNCPGNDRYYFGYPTFFQEEMLKHPLNGKGIVPDQYIPKGTRDWIKWVADELEKNKD